MEYSEKVMEHFTNPHNVGKLDDADGVGEVGNAKCGDIMKMYLKIENDIITDVKFNTYGCASAIATSSIATDMIKGQPLSEALKLTNKAVVEALDGLPAVKIHCSVLAEQAIKAAVKDYYDKNGIEYNKADTDYYKHIYSVKHFAFFKVFEKEQFFYTKEYCKVKSPYNKGPRCTVPEASKHPYCENIKEPARL